MKTLLKFFAAVGVLAVTVWALGLWYSVYIVGKYYQSADLLVNTFFVVFPLALLVGAIIVAKQLFKALNNTLALVVLVVLVSVQGCTYAHANVQTLVTHDCGVSWRLVKAGETIGTGVSQCFYSVTIPDYPMQGDSRFRTNFKGNVIANIDLSYNYRIIDALKFIGEAKYLGKQKKDADEKANDTAFETAENVVIDKRIKDVARNLLESEDIVNFSPSDFEEKLLPKVNEVLQPLGVAIDFLSFIPVPDEQTAQAIDAATALRIYESSNMREAGIEIIKQRAGAPRHVVNVGDNK